ncbi:hypothetical protein [Clostridium sporogenes]|nr:hypothetical protein [Clostridium sporogenes]
MPPEVNKSVDISEDFALTKLPSLLSITIFLFPPEPFCITLM